MLRSICLSRCALPWHGTIGRMRTICTHRFHSEGCLDWQTLEEGQRTQQSKHWDHNKDEDIGLTVNILNNYDCLSYKVLILHLSTKQILLIQVGTLIRHLNVSSGTRMFTACQPCHMLHILYSKLLSPVHLLSAL